MEELNCMKRIALLLLASVALPAAADTPAKIYAQDLVDRTVARHPELVVLAMHVTPPKSTDNVIIASNIGRIGKKADDDDMSVVKSGKPRYSLNKAGDHFEALMPFLDANGRQIGALGEVFNYKPGDDKDALAKKAEVIRNELARRISHTKNLLEPAQFDPKVPTNSYGQALVDEALAAHPEVVILALHSVPPGSSDNEIVASNIGRIGKKADADDMEVVNTGVPKLELNEEGDRFEVEERLLDVSGDTLGAVGVVFPYKPGDDKEARHKQADQIAATLQRRITNAANLVEPYPYSPNYSSNTWGQKLVDATMAAHPELLILAIHAAAPNTSDYVIAASSIGRIGKKADEDDMGVINTGKALTEVNSTGKRLEVEMQLHDASGKTIGAVSTVFAYKAGDDKDALRKRGEKIRDEIEKQISSTAKLFETHA
jgi:hypothetical protein